MVILFVPGSDCYAVLILVEPQNLFAHVDVLWRDLLQEQTVQFWTRNDVFIRTTSVPGKKGELCQCGSCMGD